MSSIALYAGKLNQMTSLIGDVRLGIEGCNAGLFSLKSGMLNVSKSVCNLDDVISAVQTSTRKMNSAKFSKAIRTANFKNADDILMKQTGKTKGALEKDYGFKFTQHEDLKAGKIYYVPKEIHENVPHVGIVADYKFNFFKIPKISSLVGEKTIQFGFRFRAESVIGAYAGN